MTDSTLTASDVALLEGQNNNWGGGNSFLWIFALLILAGGGFGGFGNQNYRDVASQTDVQNGFNFAALERQNNEIVSAVQQGVYDTTAVVKDANYNTLGEVRSIGSALATGFANLQSNCCSIERNIDSVNYNAAINTAAINANTTEQIQKLADMIAGNRIADMQNQINQLQIQNAMAGVVRYPNASTYYAGNNPFCNCGSL